MTEKTKFSITISEKILKVQTRHGGKKSQTDILKDANGQITTVSKKIKQRWQGDTEILYVRGVSIQDISKNIPYL